MALTRRPLANVTIYGGKALDRVQLTEIELGPDQATGRHLHPVPVVGYVVAGRIYFQLEGQPERVLTAGEAFYEPAGRTILRFDNASSSDAATFVAVYLLGPGDEEVIRPLD